MSSERGEDDEEKIAANRGYTDFTFVVTRGAILPWEDGCRLRFPRKGRFLTFAVAAGANEKAIMHYLTG
jgi:hypothetical protein